MLSLRKSVNMFGALRRSALAGTFEKVFVLSATHAVSGFLVLATFVMLANKLGPRLYGEFTLVDSVLFIGILCASLGTEYVGNREVARTTQARELVSGILILRALASLAVMAAVLVWATVFVGSATLFMLTVVTSAMFLSVPGIAGWYFLAKHRIRIVAFATITRELLFFLPVLLLLDYIEEPGTRLTYAGLFYLFSRLVFAGIFLVKLLSENGFMLRVRASTYRSILKDSLTLLYASLVYSVTMSIQIYMLQLLKEDVALGVYGALFKQIFYIQLLSLSFIMVFFPMLAKAWVEDRKKYARLASALSELTLIVVLPVAVTGVLYAEYTLEVFFTNDYASGALTLQLLCLSLVPMSYVRVLTTGVLVSMDMTSKMFSLVNIAFIWSLASGVLILMFERADVGAAGSRLAAECLFAAVSYRAVAKKVSIITPAVLRSILPGIVAMLFAWALWPTGYEAAGIAACYFSFFIGYCVAFYLTRYDELRAVFDGRRVSAVLNAPEQILIGREKT